MKKFLVVLLSLCCLMCIAGCSPKVEEKYYLSDFSDSADDSVKANYDKMMEYGMYIKIYFNQDGTGYLDLLGERSNFTYDLKEKTITFDNSSVENMTFEGKNIVLSPNTSRMVFTPGDPPKTEN